MKISAILAACLATAIAAGLTGCDGTEGDVLSTFGNSGPGPGSTGDGDGDGDPTGDGDGDPTGDGDGDGDACAADGPCPLPEAGLITVCGRAYDLEDTTPVGGDPGQPGDTLAIRIFDILSFSSDPTAQPLATVQPDECGWYVAPNIEDVPPGPVVISTNDRGFPGLTFQPVHNVQPSSPGQIIRANAWTLRAQRDAQWASDAGLGGTFSSVGSLLAIYIDVNAEPTGPFQGRPVTGVTITTSGQPSADEDYYFSDTATLERRTVTPAQTTTGVNGVGLLRDLDIASSYGGTRPGCTFQSVTGLTAPGVIQVQEFNGTCDP